MATKKILVTTDDRLVYALVGYKVGVWAGPELNRNDFKTKINVTGILEQHQTDRDSFRIVNPDENYTYFNIKDIIAVVKPREGFRDGSVACIKIGLQ